MVISCEQGLFAHLSDTSWQWDLAIPRAARISSPLKSELALQLAVTNRTQEKRCWETSKYKPQESLKIQFSLSFYLESDLWRSHRMDTEGWDDNLCFIVLETRCNSRGFSCPTYLSFGGNVGIFQWPRTFIPTLHSVSEKISTVWVYGPNGPFGR